MPSPRPKQSVINARSDRAMRVVSHGFARRVAPAAGISSALSASVHQFLHPLLLGDDLCLSSAVAALALCQACAPVAAPARANAVLADLIAVAAAQPSTCGPVTGRPLTAVALIVKTVTRAGSFAKHITPGAAMWSTMRAATSWAAVACAARQCWVHANGEGCNPRGTTHERGPDRLPSSDVPRGSFREFADLTVHPCAKRRPSHDGSSLQFVPATEGSAGVVVVLSVLTVTTEKSLAGAGPWHAR
jgi:hypothetical protein